MGTGVGGGVAVGVAVGVGVPIGALVGVTTDAIPGDGVAVGVGSVPVGLLVGVGGVPVGVSGVVVGVAVGVEADAATGGPVGVGDAISAGLEGVGTVGVVDGSADGVLSPPPEGSVGVGATAFTEGAGVSSGLRIDVAVGAGLADAPCAITTDCGVGDGGVGVQVMG